MPRKVVHATILLFTPDSIRTLRHAYLSHSFYILLYLYLCRPLVGALWPLLFPPSLPTLFSPPSISSFPCLSLFPPPPPPSFPPSPPPPPPPPPTRKARPPPHPLPPFLPSSLPSSLAPSLKL